MIKNTNKTENKPMNFSIIWDSDYWMSSNGMYCGFNMPDALTDSESAQGLPPFAKRKFYLADEYPACPKNWVPSSGRKTSYFVPVKEGQGMWLDFTKNENQKYHVAIVISVQGINPITGLPCKDAALEQYIDTCPKHNKAFGPHRFCEECGYKWPKQNYICTTGTPQGNLWLDGFRAANGVVRQYVLTMDKIKGVASNIIGEDRVFAVGISFFFSNNPKPVVMQTSVLRNCGGQINNYYPTFGSIYTGISNDSDMSSSPPSYHATNLGGMSSSPPSLSTPSPYVGTDSWTQCCSPSELVVKNLSADYSRGNSAVGETKTAKSKPNINITETDLSVCQVNSISVKKVEVGAGSKISQDIHDDPEPIEFWRKEPEAIILINYCTEKDCEKIIRAGKVSLEGHSEAFLKEIPKGNEQKVLEVK